MIHGDMPDGAAWIAMAGPVGAGIFNGAWQRQIELSIYRSNNENVRSPEPSQIVTVHIENGR